MYTKQFEEYLNYVVDQYKLEMENVKNGDGFIFITDFHFQDNDKISPILIREIGKRTDINKVFCGGDFPYAFGSKNDCIDDTVMSLELLSKVKDKMELYIARGNHDCTIRESSASTVGYTAPYNEVHKLLMGYNSAGTYGPKGKNYYYVDDNAHKIRYVVVDTSEIHKNEEQFWGILPGMCEEQLEWLATQALVMGDEGVGWSVIVIGHIPCDDGLADYCNELDDLANILKAYRNKTICKYGDFSNEKAEFVAYLCGHNHQDMDVQTDNTLFISTGCDAVYQDDIWGRVPGKISGVLFDIFIIDKEKKVLKTIRVGAGGNRMFSYGETQCDEQRLKMLKMNRLFVQKDNEYSYSGFIDKTIRYIEDFQLLKPELWKRFVRQFNEDADYDAGWRGEFWGKMMRGACMVYSYTKNQELYDLLTQTVSDMMDSADKNGRISSYGIGHEFDGWDIWGRKYVLLGMQYFIEICKDEAFVEKIVKSMKGQMDYIISKIGRSEEGKKPITSATRHWRGLNSASLLEPVVRLYSITNEKKYLEFAEYIIETGCTDIVNIFELTYQNELQLHQYPVTKAYEMTSCFEGLLEYYRITGNAKHKRILILYANKILQNEFTVIGGSGCTHELFDHSTVRQANTTNETIMQETCVTVTIMKFFYQLYLLTGHSKFADAFEKSFYNAYLGAINTEKVIEPSIREEHSDWYQEALPFDSYSPLTAGTRGNGVGGLKVMSDNHYYGCCACIGSAGIGIVPYMQIPSTKDGFVLNLFIPSTVKTKTPGNREIIFNTKTEYPKNGKVEVIINIQEEENFQLLVRNPAWSNTTEITVNGETIHATEGYTSIRRKWSNNDRIEIQLDMQTKVIYPTPYGSQILMNNVIWGHNYVIPTYDKEDPIAKKHIALRRGPIMLAQENRLGYSVDEPISIKVNEDKTVDVVFPEKTKAPYENIVEVSVPLTNGEYMTVTDYASAGKLWTEESKMAVWMLTE